jgi:hypothetical protein
VISEDGVPILQDMECLYCMPVIKMEIIKFPIFIKLVEIFNHPETHTITIFHNVVALGLAVMIVNSIDRLVLNPAAGKEVNFVMLCQGFREMGCSSRQASHTLGIEGLPAENGYLKRLQR